MEDTLLGIAISSDMNVSEVCDIATSNVKFLGYLGKIAYKKELIIPHIV